ncbi:pfkB family kinase [Mollisia scopiformis]|uniref:PfkB family kinase n=1 Tax=Mollisia scopiformis TaxID=149040 RepID=A0A194WVZ9_MOLSC|nr:pfkB family kinase [Mollisia scopiformis]KUJ11849.1 pfkB family kinase [Mollisia scopiformis]
MGSWFSGPQAPDVVVTFVSLGMVVLDELRFPGKKLISDVMGGSASYGTLGARLFAMNRRSTSIGCLVLAGKDFPEAVEKRLREWNMALVLKKDLKRLSTRGLLEDEDTTFGPKKFRYTTEPLKPLPHDLFASPLLASHTYHFLAAPEDLTRQVSELLELRMQKGIDSRPLLVWEPFPPACQAESLKSILAACSLVDVFSPNHLEITRLFTDADPEEFQPKVLESYAQKFLDHSIGPHGKGCIVIRAAEHGSLSASRAAGCIWSPAFYPTASDLSRIVDPTGAGNAFIGGFATGLQEKRTLDQAAAYGNVAASFALEQIGLPTLEVNDSCS